MLGKTHEMVLVTGMLPNVRNLLKASRSATAAGAAEAPNSLGVETCEGLGLHP